MSFLRRFRRDRTAPAEPDAPAESPEDVAPAPTSETEPEPSPPAEEAAPVSEPTVSGPVEAAVPTVPTSRPPTAISSVPPPLPGRSTAPPTHPGAERGSFSRCFVCRSPLDGGTCPTCRITWME